MNITALIFGSLFGFLAIILGAFGAHLLKKKLSTEHLQSFETGVKYQMYHAIVLLILGFQSKITNLDLAINTIIIGTILFSFSIYGLVISSAKNRKIKILGPITPIGGLILLFGWGILLYTFLIKL